MLKFRPVLPLQARNRRWVNLNIINDKNNNNIIKRKYDHQAAKMIKINIYSHSNEKSKWKHKFGLGNMKWGKNKLLYVRFGLLLHQLSKDETISNRIDRITSSFSGNFSTASSYNLSYCSSFIIRFLNIKFSIFNFSLCRLLN